MFVIYCCIFLLHFGQIKRRKTCIAFFFSQVFFTSSMQHFSRWGQWTYKTFHQLSTWPTAQILGKLFINYNNALKKKKKVRSSILEIQHQGMFSFIFLKMISKWLIKMIYPFLFLRRHSDNILKNSSLWT